MCLLIFTKRKKKKEKKHMKKKKMITPEGWGGDRVNRTWKGVTLF